jgi:hypothetical protein
MKLITQLILILLLTFTINPAYGEDEIYYCADTDGIGFSSDKERGSYKRTGFSSEKFKIKFDKANKSIEVAKTDGEKEVYTCTIAFPKYPNSFQCQNNFYMFNFNADNGRYVSAKGYGYVISDDDSVGVSIGKCDKF